MSANSIWAKGSARLVSTPQSPAFDADGWADIIAGCWSAATSSDTGWAPENPALGQCAVTACLFMDFAGGEMLWAKAVLPDGSEVSHYWNLSDGGERDLTRSQFPVGTRIPAPQTKDYSPHASLRDYVLSFPQTAARYALLKKKTHDAASVIWYFHLLQKQRRHSHDPDTQIGFVAVTADDKSIIAAANSFPEGVRRDIPGRLKSPGKYFYIEHAERVAIFEAARVGISLNGATAYMRGYPCADCARGIISSGIRLINTAGVTLGSHWHESQEVARAMLAEAGVTLSVIPLPKSLRASLEAVSPLPVEVFQKNRLMVAPRQSSVEVTS
jgi:deoxycytidylate deaminase